jgi:hypothetical protein
VTQIVVDKYGGAVVSAAGLERGAAGAREAAWALAADAALAEDDGAPNDWTLRPVAGGRRA